MLCRLLFRVATVHGQHTTVTAVSGCARPFQLHALIGTSGSGKSTLLDILAMRKLAGGCTGALLSFVRVASDH